MKNSQSLNRFFSFQEQVKQRLGERFCYSKENPSLFQQNIRKLYPKRNFFEKRMHKILIKIQNVFKKEKFMRSPLQRNSLFCLYENCNNLKILTAFFNQIFILPKYSLIKSPKNFPFPSSSNPPLSLKWDNYVHQTKSNTTAEALKILKGKEPIWLLVKIPMITMLKSTSKLLQHLFTTKKSRLTTTQNLSTAPKMTRPIITRSIVHIKKIINEIGLSQTTLLNKKITGSSQTIITNRTKSILPEKHKRILLILQMNVQYAKIPLRFYMKSQFSRYAIMPFAQNV